MDLLERYKDTPVSFPEPVGLVVTAPNCEAKQAHPSYQYNSLYAKSL